MCPWFTNDIHQGPALQAFSKSLTFGVPKTFVIRHSIATVLPSKQKGDLGSCPFRFILGYFSIYTINYCRCQHHGNQRLPAQYLSPSPSPITQSRDQ